MPPRRKCDSKDRLECEIVMAQRKVEFSMYLDEDAAAYLSLVPVDDVGAETVNRSTARSVRLMDLVGEYIGPELVFDFNEEGVLLGVEVVS